MDDYTFGEIDMDASEHYGDLGIKTVTDTRLNSASLGSKPCALCVFLSSKESGGFMLIPS